jgi:tRNA U38,U39,U40 pseudouridine synthase TruA
VDFVRFEIQGQSFMLHQIRRMIGIATIRDHCTALLRHILDIQSSQLCAHVWYLGMIVFLIKRNLPKEVLNATFVRKAPVPTAPSEGLLLQQVPLALSQATSQHTSPQPRKALCAWHLKAHSCN